MTLIVPPHLEAAVRALFEPQPPTPEQEAAAAAARRRGNRRARQADRLRGKRRHGRHGERAPFIVRWDEPAPEPAP